MTLEQFWFYLLNPRAFLRFKLAQLAKWRVTRKARKAAREYMRSLREMEANLKAAAYPSCSHCFGQGHRGFNLTTKQWVVCRCTFNPRTQDRIDAHSWLRG